MSQLKAETAQLRARLQHQQHSLDRFRRLGDTVAPASGGNAVSHTYSSLESALLDTDDPTAGANLSSPLKRIYESHSNLAYYFQNLPQFPTSPAMYADSFESSIYKPATDVAHKQVMGLLDESAKNNWKQEHVSARC